MKIFIDGRESNFVTQEWIPRELHHYLVKRYGYNNKNYLTAFFRYVYIDTIKCAQNIRVFLGVPMYINTWHVGGKFNYRGWRPTDYYLKGDDETKNLILSQHQRGLACDFHTNEYTPDQLRDKILPRYRELGFWRIEMGVNWVHFDLAKGLTDELVKFYP